MIRKPSVSIVVPNFNQGRFLEEALQSIIKQPQLDIRIAVMDAGSTDQSVAIIRKYENYISYWQSKPDNGQAAAINEGVALLPPSDYVCWLNADDVFLENGLARMVDYLETNNQCMAVYAKAYITDIDNQVIAPYKTESFSQKGLATQCFICQPATLMRTEAWNKVGGLNASLQMCLDYDLWWRLSKVGEFGYLTDFVACSRDHEGTKTRNNQKTHFNEAFQLLKKYNGYVPLNWCLARATAKEIHDPNIIRKFVQKLLGCLFYIRYRL